MKALVIDGERAIALQEIPFRARDSECRIRVRLAGICGTDLQILDGYADFRGVPGHEFVGTVEEVPAPADRALLDRRVVGEINVGCGTCEWCARGIREHCTARSVVGIRGRDGAFAEFLSLPSANLHPVPDSLDDLTAVFVEPTAAACRILEQLPIDRATRAAVLGDGRLGLLTAQVLRSAGAEVVLFGRHEEKLSLASSLGLRAECRMGSTRADRQFDVVVDATGRHQGLRDALTLVRPRGAIVAKSTVHGEAPLALWPIVVEEVTIVGSRCGPFRRAIDLLASGAVQVAPLVQRVARLEEFESAFADARRLAKVLFAMADVPSDV